MSITALIHMIWITVSKLNPVAMFSLFLSDNY